MTYEAFLIELSRRSNASACAYLEANAHRYNKSVREVCTDFKAKFGVYL